MLIFLLTCGLLILAILICSIIEKRETYKLAHNNRNKLEAIKVFKKILKGMLAGFVISVIIVVVQFVIRFGYFSLLQEMGAIFIGFIGAVVGGLIGLFNFKELQT